MNVTLATIAFGGGARQAAARRCAVATLFRGLAGLTAGWLALAAMHAETHWALQAPGSDGTSVWTGEYPFTVVGVLLTDPDEMLDATPNYIPYRGPQDLFKMGGEWQVAVQAALAGDRLGTTCWLGQNYGNHPAHLGEEFNYTDAAWEAEVWRLNHDPATGQPFRKGDLVAVTANRSLFYGGKRNINEAHSIEPAADFTMSLVISNYGLPMPETISLASLMWTDDGNPSTHEDIFDVTRATGGEHWQGMRVRLTGLSLVATNGWDPAAAWQDRLCSVTDGEGHFFALRHPRYFLGPPPNGRFDAIGVLNQESGSGQDGTFGYELFVQEIAPAADPVLTIATKITVAWPASLANYRLESAAALPASEWTPVTNQPILLDGWHLVIQEPSAAAQYYRLQRFQ